MPVEVEGLYRSFGPMVLRRCSRVLRDEEKAVDAMHDVFVQVLRHHARLSAESPSGLLLRIATRVCLNRLRSERRRPVDSDDERLLQIAASTDLEEESSVRATLRRIFGREHVSTREIAVMHLVDGLTLEEVASEVGLSVSGVRKRLRTLKSKAVSLEAIE